MCKGFCFLCRREGAMCFCTVPPFLETWNGIHGWGGWWCTGVICWTWTEGGFRMWVICVDQGWLWGSAVGVPVRTLRHIWRVCDMWTIQMFTWYCKEFVFACRAVIWDVGRTTERRYYKSIFKKPCTLWLYLVSKIFSRFFYPRKKNKICNLISLLFSLSSILR